MPGEEIRAYAPADEEESQTDTSAQPTRITLPDTYQPRGWRKESVLQTVMGESQEAFRITRSFHRFDVMRTTRFMFVDINTSEDEDTRSDLDGAAFRRLTRFCSERPECGFRAYKTRSGLRYLLTSHECAPGSRTAEYVLQTLGSDARYIRCCGEQTRYAARLTPKPWRLLPLDNPRDYAVCQYLFQIGNPVVTHQDCALVMRAHDVLSGAHEGKPLA